MVSYKFNNKIKNNANCVLILVVVEDGLVQLTRRNNGLTLES